MVKGVGTDICENKRIKKLVKKFGERFLHRIYNEEELKYCLAKKNPIPHLAARFALKEAVIKSLNLQRDLTLSYKDIGLTGSKGKKSIIFYGKVKAILEQNLVVGVNFSISHARKYSSAFVILES